MTEISRVLRDRSVSSHELVMAYLQRIEAVNPALNATVASRLKAAGATEVHPAIASQINKEWMVEGGEITRQIEVRDRFRSDMLTFMQDYDVMVTPVAGFTAALFGATEDEAHFPGYSYTQVYNLCGLPAVVVCCGTSPDGLPIGVQIAARPWCEDMALAVARHLETVFGGWMPPATAWVELASQ